VLVCKLCLQNVRKMSVIQNIKCVARHTHREAQLTEVRARCRIRIETSDLMSIYTVEIIILKCATRQTTSANVRKMSVRWNIKGITRHARHEVQLTEVRAGCCICE